MGPERSLLSSRPSSRLSSHLKRKRGRWGKMEGIGNHSPPTVEGFLLPTRSVCPHCAWHRLLP